MIGQYSLFEYRIKESCVWEKGKYSKTQAWFDLIMMHEYQDSYDFKNKREKKKGHIYTSMSTLANKWGWDRETVKRFLDTLENEARLTYRTLPQKRGVDIIIPYLLENTSATSSE